MFQDVTIQNRRKSLHMVVTKFGRIESVADENENVGSSLQRKWMIWALDLDNI
jgi:hypothetical protein